MRDSPSVLQCVLAGLTGFLLVGAVEAVLLAGDVPLFDGGPGPGLVALAHLFGLVGLAGIVVGALMGAVIPPMVEAVDPGRWLLDHGWPPSTRDTDPAALRGAGASAVGVLVALLAPMAIAGIAGRLAHGFNNAGLVAPFVALAVVGGLGAGVLVVFPVRRLALRLLDRLAPSGRLLGLPPLTWVGLAGVLVALGAAWRLSQLDLGAYKLGGLWFGLLSVAVSLLLLVTWRRRAPVRPGVASLLLLVAVAGCGAWAVLGLGDAVVSRRAIPLEGKVSRVMVLGLRVVFDFDGDGASALLGGGDCDEGNAEVGPHAKEIPGNGVDDNCVGGDAPLEDVADAPPPKPAAPPTTAGAPATEPPPPKPRHNIVFLLIDTVRPDHLGLYGYGRPTSPNIDAWAKDAVVFDQVYAQAPNTPRSVPSILTGRYPSRIAWQERFANYGSLEPENETLFELFRDNGWRTEVVSAHWYFERAKGIKDGVDQWDNRGFTTIKESNTQTIAHELTPRAVGRLEALAKGEQPFVLFVHYFEPHGRYMNQKSAKIFGSKLMDKYDSEISFVDMHLAPVFEALERLGLYENTVVALTSDHGEAFKEHGFYFHGRTVYAEETRVPLLLRVPGVAPRRVGDFVGLVDLLPTLAELVGLEAKKAQGRSLVPLLNGEGSLGDRVIFKEQLPYPNYKTHVVGALGSNGIKVIRNLTDNVTEVFDLKADPFEKTNLLEGDPDAGKAIRQALDRFIDADPG